MFDTLEYDYDLLHTRMREQAFLNAGLRIRTIDKRPGHEQEDTMCYEGGIREFVAYLNRNKTTVHNQVIYMRGANRDGEAGDRSAVQRRLQRADPVLCQQHPHAGGRHA
jgi:DNA gyrase subunit B